MPEKAQLSCLQPRSLTVVAKELCPQLLQRRCGEFLGDHRNRVKFKILIGGSRGSEKRGHHVESVSLGKRRMEQQVAAIFYIAEIQSQRTAIRDHRTDRFILVVPVGQPHAACPPEPYLTVQTVYRSQFWIACKLLGGDVNTAARDGSDQAKRFFMRGIVRDDANFPPCGQR